MATLEQVISDVLEYLDRPDLLTVARTAAREVLYKVHRAGDFHRDRYVTTPVAVDSAAASTLLNLPAAFRKLEGFIGYGSGGLQMDYAPSSAGVAPPLTYSNLRTVADTYRLAGGVCTLLHNSSSLRPSSVSMQYFAYPQVTTNEDGTVETDSWLLDNNEDAVRWRLTLQLATAISDKDKQAAATALYNESLQGLLASELIDMPEGY